MREHPLKRFYSIIDNNTPEYKIESLPEFPRVIELEITNYCDYQCIMCTTGINKLGRERGYMTSDVFNKIVDEITGKECALKFVGQGEPTLHKSFIEFVKIAKARGIITHLTTNGSNLNEKFITEIINSGLDSIKFSFQGVTSEEYYRVRRKDTFYELMERIKMLKNIRGERKTPYITIGTSVINPCPQEEQRFRKIYSEVADKIEIGITTFNVVEKLAQGEVLKTITEIKKHQSIEFKRYRCCHQVFDVITVHWNGNICACCSDLHDDMVLGNIVSNTIKSVWNGDKENMYRSILAKRDYDKLKVCKSCYDVYGWNQGVNS